MKGELKFSKVADRRASRAVIFQAQFRVNHLLQQRQSCFCQGRSTLQMALMIQREGLFCRWTTILEMTPIAWLGLLVTIVPTCFCHKAASIQRQRQRRNKALLVFECLETTQKHPPNSRSFDGVGPTTDVALV